MKRFTLLVLFFTCFINAQDWGEQIIVQPNPGASHLFGNSVSIDGDYAVVGAPNENDQTGAAHVYKKDVDGNWNHLQKITAYVGISIDEYFGSAVHIQGDFIFISSPRDRLNEVQFQSPAGSVMIYKNNGADNFVGIQRIRSSDASSGDFFGNSIDSSGDYLLVGAPDEDHDLDGNNGLGSAGSAYVFKKNNNDVWSEEQKLIPSHRAQSDRIGYSIAIEGDYIVLASKNNTDVANLNPISGNGSAFIFKKDINDDWIQMQKLKASDGAQNSYFGSNGVGISGDYITLSAIGTAIETIYMFKINAAGNSWAEVQKIVATENRGDISFGKNLALHNSYLVAAAPRDYSTKNEQNISGTGSAYIFKNNNGTWNELLRIETSDAALNDALGGGFDISSAVSFDGTNFIIGAPYKDGEDAGNTLIDAGKSYISGNINTFLGQTITWTGAISTDWNVAGNWDTNTIPSPLDDVILSDVANAPSIKFNQNQVINNLTNDEVLSIKTSASLTVLGDIDQRNAISISSFVNTNGSLIVRGNQLNMNPAEIIYLRYISGNNWHLISSPVTDFDMDVFAAATALAEGQGDNRGIGFYDNNANPNWSYYQDGANATGDFVSGKGYSIQTSGNAFLTFRGKLMSENVSNYPITENLNGWNLVGNPYPAFINANINANADANFISENLNSLDPLAANIYLWNPTTTSYDPIGNGLGAKYIAPGQGFFVKSNAGGSTINIEKTMLSHQAGDLFLKENPANKLVLQINNNALISETTIAFKEGMTNGLDVSYDATVFSGINPTFSIYTQLLESLENTPFAIQFLPDFDKKNMIIPLGILHEEEEMEITFSLKESNLDASIKVYLEDILLQTFTEISGTTGYTFFHQNDTNGFGRFFLHLQNDALNLNSVDTSNIQVYKKEKSTLQINGISNGLLDIYDIHGKIILKNAIVNSQNQTIQLPKISSGIYVIKIKKENGTNFVKKIIF